AVRDQQRTARYGRMQRTGHGSVVVVDACKVEPVDFIDGNVVEAVEDQVDETQRDLSLESLLGFRRLPDLCVAPLEEQEDLLDDLRPLHGRRTRIGVRLAQQQPLDEREEA